MKKISIFLTLLLVAVVAHAARPVADVIAEVKKTAAPDGRVAVFDVKCDEKGRVTGKVSDAELLDALNAALKANGNKAAAGVTVMGTDVPAAKRWALVKLAVASLRCEGKHSGEMATQAGMGTPVRVLEVGEWCRVQTPDRYISYVPESSLQFVSAEQLDAWKRAPRYVVTVYDTRLVSDAAADETISDLVLSNILEYRGETDKWVRLATPDGRVGYVEKSQVAALDKWAQQNYDVALIERVCRRMMGSGYLWGGTSTKVTDCSGLMKVAHLANGIILARDASQQALTGEKISDWRKAELGDLLFFGNSKTGRVTHVGMYLRDGLFIHCSGQVKINSLDEKSPLYLYSPLSISRVKSRIGTAGITLLRNHPWYMSQH